MKKLLFIAVCGFSLSNGFSQVRAIGGTPAAVTNSSAFLDASSNSAYATSVNSGKGIVFPRVDLTTFNAFLGVSGSATSFRTRYDGFIVYNTATSGVAGVGATQGTLTPGFWYYENSTADVGVGSISGGTWKPLTPASTSTTIKGLVDCVGTLTQTIANTNVTATSSIYVSYEDTTGDIIYTSIKNRVAGTGFTVQFGAIPSTAAKINYIIVNN